MLQSSRRGNFTERSSNITTIATRSRNPSRSACASCVLTAPSVSSFFDGEKYLKARLFRWVGAMSFSPLLCAYEAASSSLRNKMEIVIAHFGQGGQHGFSYDYETLARLLEDVGFVHIEHRAFRSSSPKDLEFDSEVPRARALSWKGRARRALCLTDRHRINPSQRGVLI